MVGLEGVAIVHDNLNIVIQSNLVTCFEAVNAVQKTFFMEYQSK